MFPAPAHACSTLLQENKQIPLKTLYPAKNKPLLNNKSSNQSSKPVYSNLLILHTNQHPYHLSSDTSHPHLLPNMPLSSVSHCLHAAVPPMKPQCQQHLLANAYQVGSPALAASGCLSELASSSRRFHHCLLWFLCRFCTQII